MPENWTEYKAAKQNVLDSLTTRLLVVDWRDNGLGGKHIRQPNSPSRSLNTCESRAACCTLSIITIFIDYSQVLNRSGVELLLPDQMTPQRQDLLLRQHLCGNSHY